MKPNHILLLTILLIGISLINGCGNTPEPSAAPEASSTCKLYEGTWKGVISDSGSLEVTREVNGEDVITHNPFTAQYDFEMTIEYDKEGVYFYEDLNGCPFQIRYVKASHPILGCTQGCTPIPMSEEGGLTSWLYLKSDGFGSMQIVFQNRATISTFVEANRVRMMPEGNKIELFIPENVESWETIGSIAAPEYRTIEIDNCKLFGNKYCSVEYINKNTIVLNKVS